MPIWQLHRAIGMGGDRLVAHAAGDQVETDHGDDLRTAFGDEFDGLIAEVRPIGGVVELSAAVRDRGFKIVLASSGQRDHVKTFLALFGGQGLIDGWITSEDTATSKPDPGNLRTALRKVGGTLGVVIGDSTWDCVAATTLGLPVLTLLTGGFSTGELTESGATRVFPSLLDLTRDIDTTALAQPTP